jgi:SAM-dependent methyltransferase
VSDAKSRYAGADSRYLPAFGVDASPARLHLALALAGVHWEPADRERLRVLDIGCGRGLTACLLAAANPGWEVIGLDLQPVHVAEAREIAADAGLDNARFIECDIAELDAAACARLLPEVDIVICNGVWTWVPDPVRQGIVTLLKARLVPGGLLLIGYNALPGFADCIAMQRFLMEAARGVPGGDAEKARAAFAVLRRMRDGGSPHLPRAEVLDPILEAAAVAPAYAAHEWFTPFWRPVFHADLVRDLAPAQLEFGAPARASAALHQLQLTAAQREGFARLPASMPEETLTDIFIERRFRNDIFVRGRRPAEPHALGDIRMALGINPEHAVMTLGTRTGLASLTDAQNAALLEALRHGPQRLRDLASLPACRDLSERDIGLMLHETYTAHPLWRDIPTDPAFAARATRCNDTIARRLGAEAFASQAPLGAVVPATGSAFAMGMSSLAIVAAIRMGVPADPDHLADRLVRNRDDAAAVAAVRRSIETTLTRHLAAWRAIGVV